MWGKIGVGLLGFRSRILSGLEWQAGLRMGVGARVLGHGWCMVLVGMLGLAWVCMEMPPITMHTHARPMVVHITHPARPDIPHANQKLTLLLFPSQIYFLSTTQISLFPKKTDRSFLCYELALQGVPKWSIQLLSSWTTPKQPF